MKKHTKECDECISIENKDICFDSIEEMMDYEKSQRPWYIAKWEDWIYYPVYRTIYWKIWNNIKPSTIKHYYQRAKYGYSYQDNWGIDYHLVMILLPMLENLRKNHSGISLAFYKKSDGVDKDGNPSDIADKKAEQRMYNILGEMIYGLKCDQTYS